MGRDAESMAESRDLSARFPSPCTCSECFSRQDSLTSHMRTQHSEEAVARREEKARQRALLERILAAPRVHHCALCCAPPALRPELTQCCPRAATVPCCPCAAPALHPNPTLTHPGAAPVLRPELRPLCAS